MVTFKGVKSEKLIPFLEKRKFTQENIKTMHEHLRYRKGIKEKIMIVLYNSGTLLIQGAQVPVEKLADHLRSAGIGTEQKPIKFRKELGWVIGSDETLKGDTFGGLVVAAVKADEKIREELFNIGVADSKTLKDIEIPLLAAKIRKIAGCYVISYGPEEYNREKGVTGLLNKLHKETAKYLSGGTHVVDKYPGCNVGDIAETKAEHKYIEVAAASILARSAGLEQMDFLSRKAGFKIPLGSTHVAWGLEELKKRGLPFRDYVKLHFKNVQKFLDEN